MTLVPPKGPGKLTFDLDPVGLWLFDGDLTDSSPTGNDMAVDVNGPATWTTGVDGRKCYLVSGTATRVDASVPTIHVQRVSDALTAQAVIYWSQNGIDAFGSRIFGVEGGGGSASDENVLFKLMLYNTANRMIPRFSWESLNATQEIVNANFDLVPGTWYHIAAVREAAAGGVCDARLYVNNVLIASGTGLAECVDGMGTMNVGFGTASSGTIQGLKNGTIVSCLKLNDVAFTASQIRSEWGKVQGLL